MGQRRVGNNFYSGIIAIRRVNSSAAPPAPTASLRTVLTTGSIHHTLATPHATAHLQGIDACDLFNSRFFYFYLFRYILYWCYFLNSFKLIINFNKSLSFTQKILSNSAMSKSENMGETT